MWKHFLTACVYHKISFSKQQFSIASFKFEFPQKRYFSRIVRDLSRESYAQMTCHVQTTPWRDIILFFVTHASGSSGGWFEWCVLGPINFHRLLPLSFSLSSRHEMRVRDVKSRIRESDTRLPAWCVLPWTNWRDLQSLTTRRDGRGSEPTIGKKPSPRSPRDSDLEMIFENSRANTLNTGILLLSRGESEFICRDDGYGNARWSALDFVKCVSLVSRDEEILSLIRNRLITIRSVCVRVWVGVLYEITCYYIFCQLCTSWK